MNLYTSKPVFEPIQFENNDDTSMSRIIAESMKEMTDAMALKMFTGDYRPKPSEFLSYESIMGSIRNFQGTRERISNEIDVLIIKPALGRIIQSVHLTDTVTTSFNVWKLKRKGKRKIWINTNVVKYITRQVPSKTIYALEDGSIACHPNIANFIKNNVLEFKHQPWDPLCANLI